jgi:rhamnosyl/mannosyltransferase
MTSASLHAVHVGKFYPPHRGGMETHLQDLCDALQPQIDLTVLVSSEDRQTHAEMVRDVAVTRVGRIGEAAATSVSPELVAHLKNTRADIVHLHHPNPMGFLAYLLSGHRGSLVVTYHSDIVRQKVLNLPFQLILHRVLRRASAIIASSPNYIESSAVLRKYRSKCRVIPFGLPTPAFETPAPSSITLARAQFGPRYVLAVGRLVYYKGFSQLIQAMRYVNGAKAVIVGTGPLRSALESEAEALGVAGKIVFCGEIENLMPLYCGAEMFVLPSVARSEAYGIVQMEALACGTPVINTRLDSGVPFVSIDGVTGLTVNPSDSAALGRAIQYILDHPAEQERFRRESRLRAEALFRANTMADATLSLYREIHQSSLRAARLRPSSLEGVHQLS